MTTPSLFCRECTKPLTNEVSQQKGLGPCCDRKLKSCVWKKVFRIFGNESEYVSSCGNKLVLACGSIKQNKIRFCTFCGKKIYEYKGKDGV